MRIRIGSEVINSVPPKNALRLADVQPHQVFRFARGKPTNFYIMGEDGMHFSLTNGNTYGKGGDGEWDYNTQQTKRTSLVIVYPEAELVLGPEVSTKELDVTSK